jgi:imidazoleglycerol-phosphate dehydratase
MTTILRETRETRISLSLALVEGDRRIVTGRRFLDHMLMTLAHCAGWTLHLEATGDLAHHTIEDCAIAIGDAVRAAAPAARRRYAHVTMPMDDALVECTLDAGERVFYAGPLPSALYDHWMRSFAERAGFTLHLRVLRGRDRHHVVEASFKALGFALREALAAAPAVQSTKGAVIARREA